jgi:hypothetical protein
VVRHPYFTLQRREAAREVERDALDVQVVEAVRQL